MLHSGSSDTILFFRSFPRFSVGTQVWPLQRLRFHDAGASRFLLRRDKLAPTSERGSQRGRILWGYLRHRPDQSGRLVLVIRSPCFGCTISVAGFRRYRGKVCCHTPIYNIEMMDAKPPSAEKPADGVDSVVSLAYLFRRAAGHRQLAHGPPGGTIPRGCPARTRRLPGNCRPI